MSEKKYKIAFINFNMSMAGGHRLMINYGIAMKERGHEVQFFSNNPNRHNNFTEINNGDIKIIIYKNFLPYSIFGYFHIICAFITHFFYSVWMVMFFPRYDAYIVDNMYVPAICLRALRCKTIIYCHFPEKPSFKSKNFIRRTYRWFVSWVEELGMIVASRVQVNSLYTQKTFLECFPFARWLGVVPKVLYPPTNFSQMDKEGVERSRFPARYFITLNRFVPPKQLDLAIHAFNLYVQQSADNETQLIIAGSLIEIDPYDNDCFRKLEELAIELGLEKRVLLMYNITDAERVTAITHAIALLYTPAFEHFGIVPVEAMYLRTPVLARNNGGPLESVVEGETGFLLGKEPQLWADKMRVLAEDSRRRDQMGEAGRKHVMNRFGMETFTDHAVKELESIL